MKKIKHTDQKHQHWWEGCRQDNATRTTLTGVSGTGHANTPNANVILVAHGTQNTPVTFNALVLKRTALAFFFLIALVKHGARFRFTPIPGCREQICQCQTVVRRAIGTSWACLTIFQFVLVEVVGFAKTGRRVGAAHPFAR